MSDEHNTDDIWGTNDSSWGLPDDDSWELPDDFTPSHTKKKFLKSPRPILMQ